MLRVKFESKALDFQVSLQRAHEPPVSFRLKLAGQNKGVLIREGDETQLIEVVRDR